MNMQNTGIFQLLCCLQWTVLKDKVEGFELGVEDYITEPFNFSEVLARIRAVLKTRELSRQVIAKEKRLSVLESLE